MEQQIAELTQKVDKLQQTLDWMIEHMQYARSLAGKPIYNELKEGEADAHLFSFIGGGSSNFIGGGSSNFTGGGNSNIIGGISFDRLRPDEDVDANPN